MVDVLHANITEIINKSGQILVEIDTALGNITTSLDNLQANITDIVVDESGKILAKIDTALGNITTSLDNLDAKIVDLIKGDNGVLAKIDTALGTVVAKLDNLNTTVSSVDGNVLNVQTGVGEIKDSMGGLQTAATYGVIAACIFSLIAAIAAIIILIKRK